MSETKKKRNRSRDVCQVDSHIEGDNMICGCHAVGRITDGWHIKVCKFHARCAESNGFIVEYFPFKQYWELEE